jgi:tripartite-type tricarboxylate transporter receptor subunit TctC
MKGVRRIVLAVALTAAAFGAAAQDWPARPVSVVVPFAAGGSMDVAARILAQQLSDILGQQFRIENVGGAGGMTGASRVAKAPADGYSVLHGNIATHVYSQIVYKKPLYDARADFAPVGLVAESQRILVVRRNFPADDFAGFVAYAKENHGRMQYGSAGVGSGTHVGCLLLTHAIGAEITHIPYRGTGPAMQDLVAGRIDFVCDIISNALPQIDAGAVKPLLNLGSRRALALPGVPTASERGLAGFDADGWDAYFLPKGTPEAVVRRLGEAVSATLDAPALHERYEALGLVVPAPERRGPHYVADLIRGGIERWSGPIRASGLAAD